MSGRGNVLPPARSTSRAYRIACPLILSGVLKLPLPGTPFTIDVFWAKVIVAWAIASDIWSSTTLLLLAKVSQAWW